MEPLEVFTQPWADAYREVLNSNGAYREAGRTWEGPLAFVLKASPGNGVPEDRAVLLDLWHGECRSAKAVTGDDAFAEAEYVIQGEWKSWIAALDGKLDPLKALMFGKLKLKKGKLTALLPYTRAAKEMVGSAQRVPTRR